MSPRAKIQKNTDMTNKETQNISTYDNEEILIFAITLGKRMLQAGAETYRVEVSVSRVLKSQDARHVDVFVIPTAVFISCEMNGEKMNIFERIKGTNIDLERFQALNQISRDFSSGVYGLEKAKEELDKISDTPKFNMFWSWLGACAGGGFFIFLSDGGIVEFIVSFLASGFTVLCFNALSRLGFSFFIKNVIGGFIAGLLGYSFVKLAGLVGVNCDVNLVIIGPLMTLVPGVAITTGIRDVISGDLVAGNAKIMEAVFVAIGLAFGVGILLRMVV